MSPPNCTCFHSGPSLESISDQPVVTAHPLVSGVVHLGWPAAEALLYDTGECRLTCPELDTICPLHGVPPLAALTYADQLAFRAFFPTRGESPPTPPVELEGIYPLFADKDLSLFSEPRKNLTQVGWIRLPYLYVFGAGGFHYRDRDSVELAVIELFSKEHHHAQRSTDPVSR